MINKLCKCIHPITLAGVILMMVPLIIYAHAQPLKQDPTPGSTLWRSPAEIRLTFNEPIESAVITLYKQDRFTVVNGVEAQQDPNTPAEVYAPLPQLSPDIYLVQWEVHSQDDHPLVGSYAFQVSGNFLDALRQIPSWVLILGVILLVSGSVLLRPRRAKSAEPSD